MSRFRAIARNRQVRGFPTSLDTHVTPHEVYLLPAGDDDTAIGVSLEAIERAELMWPEWPVRPLRPRSRSSGPSTK